MSKEFHIGNKNISYAHHETEMAFAIASAFFAVSGTLGINFNDCNLLTISALIWSGTLKNSILNIIIVNMSFADLIVSCFVNTFTVVGSQIGHLYFRDKSFLCEFIASLCLVACVTSLMNIFLIAFNRYIQICFNKATYDSIFTVRKAVLWCVFTWIIGILIDLPNFLGWGGHSYDQKSQSCLWDRTASFSYTLFFSISSIMIPCLFIAFFYAKIFLVVFDSKSKVNKHAFKTSVRISKGMFLTYLMFVILWLPYGLLVTIDYKDKQPKEAYMWLMGAAHANSTFNPILFYQFNSQIERIFKKFFKNLFKMLKNLCRCSKVDNKASKKKDTHSSEYLTMSTKNDLDCSSKNLVTKKSNKNLNDCVEIQRETVL